MKLSLLGIPTHFGGHISGPELTPLSLRNRGLISKLIEKKIEVTYSGDIKLQDCMPRNISPPILNWPSPRIIWEETKKSLEDVHSHDNFLLVVGGDCSVIVGTTSFLSSVYEDDLHVILVDSHVDNFKPRNNMKVGAATMGIWLLANENMFWEKPNHIDYSSFSVIGCHDFSALPVSTDGIDLIPLEKLRVNGIKESVSDFLAKLPENKKIFIHFDVDVIKESEMPAAYFPCKDGLTFDECHLVLIELLKDDRIIGLEMTEFSALKDVSGELTEKLVHLLVNVISQKVTRIAK
ncbi:MAG TPA: arginase family protein [Pseudoneobacillus sp.]|nr:arginase family protein [Pseudoneobacillus sp.]